MSINYTKQELFSKACEKGDVSEIKRLIKSGIDINSPSETPPIISAVISGSLSAVEVLLANGADMNKRDEYGNNALHHAFDDNNLIIVMLLMSYGMDINSINDNEGFSEKYKHFMGSGCLYYESSIDFYLESGGEIKELYTYREDSPNLIDHIVFTNNSLALRTIIKQYRDINRTWDNEGNTIMHYAARSNNFDTIAALIELGADTEVRNKKGETPLMLSHEEDIIDYLVSAGANINAEDYNGNTALYKQNTAKGYNHSILRRLIMHGADINHRNNSGDTPLHSYLNDKELYRHRELYLVDKGADLNIKNREDKSAKEMFIERGHPYLKYILTK